jgi:hypothetical protein
MTTAPHILMMEGNQLGNDWITTDPHGELDTLQKVVALMQENDRLFICGDLVDRGKKSLELLYYLRDLKRDGKQIFCVRGNHEDMVFNTLSAIEAIKENDDQDNYENLLEEFYENIYEDDVIDKFLKKINNINIDNETFQTHLMHIVHHVKYNYGGWLLDLSEDNLNFVKSFIEALPYIIYVDKTINNNNIIPEFQIVHAAPPEEEWMQCYIHNLKNTGKDQPLNDEQIEYITWARPEEKDGNNTNHICTQKRTLDSIRAYVGHNVLGALATEFENTNILCLDAGTAFFYVIFVVNHTSNKIEKIEDNNADIDLDDQIDIMNAYYKLKEIISFNNETSSDVTSSESFGADSKEQSYQDDNRNHPLYYETKLTLFSSTATNPYRSQQAENPEIYR